MFKGVASLIYKQYLNIKSRDESHSKCTDIKMVNDDKLIFGNVETKKRRKELINKLKKHKNTETSVVEEDTFKLLVSELNSYFCKEYSIDEDINILKFWEDNKNEYVHIYALSCIVHAVPCSQVSVDRAFSTLKFIFSDLRNRMQKETLEDVMLLKLNT